MQWYLDVLRKYAVFTGRARRREFWYFALFNFFVQFAILLVVSLLLTLSGQYNQLTVDYVSGLYSLAVLFPSVGVAIRRLHDIGASGWWLLIIFIPFLGATALLVMYCLDSQPGTNQYGPNPKAVEAATPAAV
jgi:uncharacterized membrane protein YhaH (DUF805 family)